MLIMRQLRHTRLFSTGGTAPLAVAVHGGAWAIPDKIKKQNLAACEAAASLAYGVLQTGGSALDAVERAVCLLESDTSLNAGRGCSLNAAGQPELDALLMESSSLRCGSVAGVSVRHPISLARYVMEKSDHVLLVGSGAMAFAQEEGMSAASFDELVTEEALEEWRSWREYRSNVASLFAGPSSDHPGDTVGCVALDASGRLACGTSTGGVVGKRPGRVGDSPLVGCGGYADEVGAVSATGHGEAIARVTLSRLVLWLVEKGRSPSEAAEEALETMKRRCGENGGGSGGVILVTRLGHVAKAFTTKRMAWAAIEGSLNEDGRTSSGIER